MSTIAQQLQELAQIKEEIRQAIINKGVTVSSDAAFSTYATAIGQISGGGGGEEFAALIDRSIEEVVIPSGVTKIGFAAFMGCNNFTSFSVPNGITIIDSHAFRECLNLASVTLPSSLTSIGNSVFYSCKKLVNLDIPNGVTSLGQALCQLCSVLTEVNIPSSVTTIGNGAFTQCDKLATIICRRSTPPSVATGTFGTASNSYCGRTATGSKILYVPHGCSSAYTGATGTAWVDTLFEPTRCNFTIAELDENGNKPES